METSHLGMFEIISLIIGVTTLGVVFFGYRLGRRHLSAQALRDRLELLGQADTAVTDLDVRALEDFPENYIDEETYTDRYKGDDQKLRRYLTCYRIYHFLLYSQRHERLLGKHFDVDINVWVRELAEVPEFLDVHHRMARYYQDFARFLGRKDPKFEVPADKFNA